MKKFIALLVPPHDSFWGLNLALGIAFMILDFAFWIADSGPKVED